MVWYNNFGIFHCTRQGVSGNNFQNRLYFFLKIFLSSTNSVDLYEVQHYAAFHMGLRCLQKYCILLSGDRFNLYKQW